MKMSVIQQKFGNFDFYNYSLSLIHRGETNQMPIIDPKSGFIFN